MKLQHADNPPPAVPPELLHESGLEEGLQEVREEVLLRVGEVSDDVAELAERVDQLEATCSKQDAALLRFSAQVDRLERLVRDMSPMYEQWYAEERRSRERRSFREEYLTRSDNLRYQFIPPLHEIRPDDVVRVSSL